MPAAVGTTLIPGRADIFASGTLTWPAASDQTSLRAQALELPNEWAAKAMAAKNEKAEKSKAVALSTVPSPQ